MDAIVTTVVTFLILATLVALIARRLAFPYTVGLVLTGIVLAVTEHRLDVVLSHDFVFSVILPPLLYEAAINLHWKELRRDALPVLTLALAGTMVAAAVVSAGMLFALDWPLAPALVFGTLIAATDPVAVIAMFKDNGVAGRLRLLVESESLFNDGVAAVLFTLVLLWIQSAGGAPVTATQVLRVLVSSAGGGIVVGFVCARATIAIAGNTTDHLVEATLTTVAAYGSFIAAEHLHVSGVLATVTAGLLTGTLAIGPEAGDGGITRRGREFVLALWEFIAFIANSIVFLEIGLSVADISFGRLGFARLAAVIGLVLLGRALTVYPLCLLFARSRWALPVGYQHVLWWGGLRGALSLALALSLPPSLPLRDEILVATFGVVTFSVILQGLTMPPLLRRATRRAG